jgi:aminopeptidase N
MIYYLLLILSCFSFAVHAQEYRIPFIVSPAFEESKQLGYEQCGHANSLSKKEHMLGLQAQIVRPYDILSYDVFMDWQKPFLSPDSVLSEYTFSGHNTIAYMLIDSLAKEIVLNGALMTIDSISHNGVLLSNISFTQPYNGEWKCIPGNTLKTKDTNIIKIWYTYKGNGRDGLFVFPKGMYVDQYPGTGPNYVEEKLVYTMSEPEDARIWMPCNDIPNDKARSSITVRVPFKPSDGENNISVAANGNLISIKEGPQSLNIQYRDFYFQDTTLISTYLMVANASKFKVYSDWYVSDDKKDSIEIKNYVWQKDYDGTKTDGSEYNATYSLGMTVGMMKAFTDKLVPYPFKRYGHTSVQPFSFGGMEHQTQTTINRTWLAGKSGYGIAHELMHQWTGDLVTCGTWGDIWLNEGGATWGEALWGESWGGRTEYMNRMLAKRRDYLNINNKNQQPPIYGISIDIIFNYATTYAKSSWIYHMLRTMLGDSLYYSTLNKYMNDYAYGNAITDDIKSTFKKYAPNPKIPYDIFFDQWVMKPGHPILQFASLREFKENNGDTIVQYIIQQKQSAKNVPTVFHLPFTITFYGENGKKSTQDIIMTDRVYEGYIRLPFRITKAVIDEQHDILAEKDTVSGVFLSAESDYIPTDCHAMIYSNAIESRVKVFSTESRDINIQVYTIQGRNIASISESILSNEQKDLLLPDLQEGSYFISIQGMAKPILLNWQHFKQ